ncbi:hypothetical protein [Edaphobacter modestus]|uniref:Uncharacterized protein n=1 Tax=Edaphobacter modestus TaxID=388466 RepID=A0A4Q7YYH0_9BACT|nr:hypothetical protein [Edaphobacter modestus]RZU42927.1 hypothetical protein BDD14_4528 [Edaphobacter modestus]
MAPDPESPTKIGHRFQEFDLTGETAIRLEVGRREEIEAGLSTMMSCVDVLLRARDEGTIRFAEGVTGRMFETMGVLLMRAAHVNERSREAMFQHWQAHGPEILESLIADVAARQGKMLMPEDLAAAFMGTPPGY